MAAHSLTLGRQPYPVVLPSLRDPRLHVASVIITIHVLGQVALGFQVSVPQILAAILAQDGMFFDNFFTSQSWLTTDYQGNPVQVDADGDGKLDDPVWLDAAWRAGVFAELAEWRKLMPYAYASGHLPRPPTADELRVIREVLDPKRMIAVYESRGYV